MTEGRWVEAGGWRQVWLEAAVWMVGVVVGGWCGWWAGMDGLVGIRYGVSLPNRTETPQYWQYIYR